MSGHGANGPPDPGGDGSAGDQPADPLTQLGVHLKELVALGIMRVSLSTDRAVGRVLRFLVHALLVLLAACLALFLGCLGAYHLVTGAVGGLEALLGNRWSASLIVGLACLGIAVAVIALPLRHVHRSRMLRLMARYPIDPPGGP